MKTNQDRLPIKSLIGEVKPMETQSFGFMAMDSEGQGQYRAGTGGISYNVRLGDSCMDVIGEKLQPGISTRYSGAPDPAAGPFGSPAMMAYNIYACVGNEVTIAGGPLAGKKGFVTGKISGFGVTVDFNSDIVQQMHGDEHFYIKAQGVGMQIEGFEETVAVHNTSPLLFEKMGYTLTEGKIHVPVKKIIPGFLIGPGIGGNVLASCCEIMTDHGEGDAAYGLSDLCYGDIIAITDLDTTSGRTFLEGAVSIGMVVSGDSVSLGAGPGVMTLLASKSDWIVPVLSETANLKNYLPIQL